jgi:hypothetical protein
MQRASDVATVGWAVGVSIGGRAINACQVQVTPAPGSRPCLHDVPGTSYVAGRWIRFSPPASAHMHQKMDLSCS